MKKSIDILWQNEDVVAVNKAAGMLSIPDRWDKNAESVLQTLRTQFGDIYTVHRLDKETSGVLLFAKNAEAHKALNKQFEDRQVRKVYDVLIHGTLENSEGMIDGPIAEDSSIKGKMMAHKKGKPAQTFYRNMESYGRYSYIQAQPLTGRTHQIRVHLQDIGHPLLVDPLYGGKEAFFLSGIKPKYKTSVDEKPLLSRVSLHARKITFLLPGTFTEQVTEVEMPKDMLAVVQQMRRILKS